MPFSVSEIFGLLFALLSIIGFKCRPMVDRSQTALESVQEGMSETERSERTSACRRKVERSPKRKTDPPVHGGEQQSPANITGAVAREAPPVGALYPSLRDLDNSSSTSDSDQLDKEDLESLEEEAARYEEEKYHPRGLLSHTPATAPSAPLPPPYNIPPASGAYRLPDKLRRKMALAYPVFENEGVRQYAPVNWQDIKELAESVRKYGPTASFTLIQLDRLAAYAMTPADWLAVVQAALPNMGQYLEWKALWHDAALKQARLNAASENLDQRQWSADMLTGQGQYVNDQSNYPGPVYSQVSATAIKAWKLLPKKGEANIQLSKIVQKRGESFSDFVARMSETAGRIFGDSDPMVREPFLQQLIFENASQECRAALAPRRDKGLADWLRTCRNIGEPLTNTGLAAAIIQTQKGMPIVRSPRVCYKCGKPGHLKKQCPQADRKPVPPSLCARCGKGYHKAALCRSVRDLQGRLLPPLTAQDMQPKNGVTGPRFQGPKRTGTNWIAQSGYKNQEVTNQTCQEETQGDWTSVPPPTSC